MIRVRSIERGDRPWIVRRLEDAFGDVTLARKGTLMDAARDRAGAAGCRRLWLVTNDNARAIRFYQLWGMDVCAFYRHGARRSREVKPSLPERGADGLPLEHELEFELVLEDTVRSGVTPGEGTQPTRPEPSENAGSEIE